MNNKPWYIWFSVFAFMIVWGDTARRIKYNRDNWEFWPGALWNGLRLWIFYVMFIPVTFGTITGNLFLRDAPSDSTAFNLIALATLTLIYLGGVRATYQHYKWRKDKIYHLI